MSDRRAERRRAEREARRVIVGDGIVATGTGDWYEARKPKELPPKVPGRHRWIAIASYTMTVESVRVARDADIPKYLDQENLFMLAVGCYDCERQLGDIEPDSICMAAGAP